MKKEVTIQKKDLIEKAKFRYHYHAMIHKLELMVLRLYIAFPPEQQMNKRTEK